MRTIHRAYPEYFTGILTETQGKDITADTIQVGLSADWQTVPIVWAAPAVLTRPTISTARVSMLIDSSVSVGRYVMWAKLADSPETLPRPATNEDLYVV